MPELAQEQATDESLQYKPRWHLGAHGDDPGSRVREFQQLIQQAMSWAGVRFENPDRAVDAWLDAIRKEGQYPDAAFIGGCVRRSARHCVQYMTRVLDNGDRPAEVRIRHLKQQFLRMSKEQGEVFAGLIDQAEQKEQAAASRAPSSPETPAARPPASESIQSETPEQKSQRRKAVIKAMLADRSWSIGDWASEAKVDYNTADDYLKGLTDPRASTRGKLAAALNIESKNFPM
jgi:hypothetical protein